MSVHDIGEFKTTGEPAAVPHRHKNWRKDWERMLRWPDYECGHWYLQPLTMVAAHLPTKAAFQLSYGPDCLLSRISFLPRDSEAPASGWQANGPEIRELISQITEFYIRRWEDS